MSPERARDISDAAFAAWETSDDSMQDAFTNAILAACREERHAALAEAATLFASAKHQQMILDFIGEKLRYGCHCDIESMGDGFEPDDCVFDNGDICNCVYATKLEREGKSRDDCEYWKPIRFALRDKEQP